MFREIPPRVPAQDEVVGDRGGVQSLPEDVLWLKCRRRLSLLKFMGMPGSKPGQPAAGDALTGGRRSRDRRP